MVVLLDYGISCSGMGTEDSVISSPCSGSGMMNCNMHELSSFHLNYDRTFDLGPREFYDNISLASTPSAVRSSELLPRNGYDTDDSGFNESLAYDADLLQMSNLHLGDETHSENVAKSRWSNAFPLPKLNLLSDFDEDDDSKVINASHESYEQNEARPKSGGADVMPHERMSVRRQRSPDGFVERCSRSRLSLDSFSESHTVDSSAVRRYSDSFLGASTTGDMSADLSSPALDTSCILLPPSSEDALHSDLSPTPVALASDILSPSVSEILHQKPANENQLLEESLLADKVFDPSPVADADIIIKANLQCILAKFAPPCLDQLIGRKMGLRHVDVISELYDRSMSMIVQHICNYLTDVDLCR